MLDEIAELFTLKLIKEKAIDPNRKDIYLYGFKLLFSTSSSLFSIFTISVLTENTVNGIIYIIIFMSLRITANGYHAETFLGCFLVTNFFFLIYIISIRFILIPSHMINKVVLILCLIYIWIKAPIEHPNHKLSTEKKNKNRMAARCIILIDIFAVFILYHINANQIAQAISNSIYIVVIMMIMRKKGGMVKCGNL